MTRVRIGLHWLGFNFLFAIHPKIFKRNRFWVIDAVLLYLSLYSFRISKVIPSIRGDFKARSLI